MGKVFEVVDLESGIVLGELRAYVYVCLFAKAYLRVHSRAVLKIYVFEDTIQRGYLGEFDYSNEFIWVGYDYEKQCLVFKKRLEEIGK